MPVQIRLLGHLEASIGDHPVALGGSKQRAVLAMLGLDANRTVTADRLIEGLWGEEPPPSAAKMVQNYVWRLRKSFDTDGGAAIVTRGRAYELQIDSELVDVHRFERLVAEARRAAPDGDRARQALALFRGDPLADVAGEPFAGAEIRRLEELRLTAEELAIDSDLAAGRHQDVVAEIEALLAENPLRERLHAQLMLALYRCGRQAEALEAYRHARETLVEEIGIEPGPELRQLHAAILRQDPALNVEPAATTLPPELDGAAAPPLFARDDELERLRGRWRGGEGGLVTLAGAYGMGKTRIAAELALACHREGAAVLYASGTGAPEAALAAIARAAAARRPTLLVLDDADRAPVEVRRALRDLAGGPALALATGQEAAALSRLEPREAIRLEPLDAGAVRAIAGLYAPAGGEIPEEELLAASRGVPRRAHEAASDWARREATRRVDALAGRTATGRSEARALADELAGSVVDLQSTRERAAQFGAGRPEDPVVCPYKGLAPFDRDDAEYFFGREELVAELVAHVVGAPLLAVVGPSGSGKSSVVRAGLCPALAGGVLPGSHNWMQAVIRPGAHPLHELQRAVRRLERHERSVLVVDQFEELFTACQDERERGEFAGALLALPRTLVVIAIRADFYGRCAAYPELSRALGANHVLVGAMARDELRRAIERPAQRVGLSVEPDLVDALLGDVENQPGALPLLSTALLELWSQRQGRQLQLAAYARSGGVQGAVARLAEEAFVALDADQQAAARTLLLRLSDEDESGAVVRRRINLEGQDPGVVAQLADRRLLTVSDGTVEVAHEALLREWPRLRGWLEEDAQGRRLHRALGVAARAWERDARDSGGLYRGARLAAALDWAAGHDGELDATERAFLEAARRASGRAQRRLRLVLASVAVLLILAVVAGVVALDQRNVARDQATTAAAQRLGAQALASNDLDRSLLLARQGLALGESVQTRGNLLSTLLKNPAAVGVIGDTGGPATALDISPDGRTLAVLSDGLRFYDTQSRRPLGPPQTIPGATRGNSVRFDADGARLALGGQFAHVYDFRTRRTIAQLRTSAFVFDLQFAPDGSMLAAIGTADGRAAVQRFNARTGASLGSPVALGRITAFAPPAVLVARDGRRIVTSLGGGRVELRDARTLEQLRTFDVRATALALSPDDRTLLVGGRDGSVRFLDLESGALRIAAGRHDGAVRQAAFTRDGRTAATSGLDNRIDVWDVARRAVRESLTGHSSEITKLSFSRDGHRLYSGGWDSKVVIWDVAGDGRFGRPFAIGPHEAQLPAGARYIWATPLSYDVARDGRTLALGNDDGTVSVIDVRTLRKRATLPVLREGPIASVGYMPDGRLLVSDHYGVARLVDPRTGAVGRPLDGLGTPFTPSFSRDRRLMALVGPGGTVVVRSWPDGRPRNYGTDALAVSLSPDGRTLAVVTSAGVEIVDVATLRRRLWLPNGPPRPSTARFSPDGRFLVAGGVEGWVGVWSTETWRLESGRIRVGPVDFLAVSPDSRTVAVGGIDLGTSLIDMSSYRALGTPLPGVSNRLAAPLFTPDGEHLFVITDAGRAFRWDVRVSSWARRACDVAGRRLTRAEWSEEMPGREYAPAC
jgi:DNA-binding SARP family transcriptional activator/WD40 repeat protein